MENLYKLKILQKAHKFYYSNTNNSLIVHSYSTRFSISNLPVPFSLPLQVKEVHVIGSQRYGTG